MTMLNIFTIPEIITILAILVGPIAAVQVDRYLAKARDAKRRKEDVFKTLMITRAQSINFEHVKALNAIDLEFDGRKRSEKGVIDAWKKYLDHLGDKPYPADHWNAERIKRLIKMLHEMACALDYEIDETHIKNGIYSPEGHVALENDQFEALKGWIDVLNGNRAVPIRVVNMPDNSDPAD